MSAAAPAASDASAPKKSKKLLIAAIAAVFALAGGGGGAYFYMKAKHAAEEDGDDEPEAKPAKASKKDAKGKKGEADKKKKKKAATPPVFVPLEVFTVNLQGNGGREQMLQVGMTLEMEDALTADALKAAMPAIRGQLLLLLASKTAEQLAKPEGKEALATEIIEKITKPAEGIPAIEGAQRIHYSAFIIQ